MKANRILILTIAILSFLPTESIFGQIFKNRNFETTIHFVNKKKLTRRNLYEVGDSTLTLTKFVTNEKQIIDINEIERIDFREKGAIGRGVVIGAIVGFGIGAFINYSNSDPIEIYSLGPFVSGILGSFPGAIFGGVYNAVKIKIPINGRDDFQKEQLEKYKLRY